MPRKRTTRQYRKDEDREPNHGALYGDPVERVPVFGSRSWEGHNIHTNPVHAKASPETITAMARKHTAEALLTLVYWMRSRDPTISIPAVKELLERGWGKSAQVVGLIDGTLPSNDMKRALSVEEKRRALIASVASEITELVPDNTPIPIAEGQDSVFG